jgi:hypothetical protein
MHIAPNGKRYVGITSKKPQYRWNNGNGYKSNKHFYNAILKYGWDNIEHIIVADKLTKECACAMEQELIEKYDTTNSQKGFNHSIGGESGSLGVKYPKEVIQRRLKNRVYMSSWAKGKKFSPEHIEKIRIANTGKKHTEETKRKLSETHKGKTTWISGKTMSDEVRAKESIPILCIETDIVYFGMMEAERQTGIHHNNICKCAKGERKTAGGYHWKYADK